MPRNTSSETMRDACPGFVPGATDAADALPEESAGEFPAEVFAELSGEFSDKIALENFRVRRTLTHACRKKQARLQKSSGAAPFQGMKLG